MWDLTTRAIPALLPVGLYLVVLVGLDGYKLVRRRDLALAICAGALASVIALGAHRTLPISASLTPETYARYLAPPLEELLKAAIIVWMMRRHRIGFLVDGAILGFAVGAGFAVIENIWFLGTFSSAPFALWLVRGFGTAIMHGAATILFVFGALTVGGRGRAILGGAAGLLFATALHSAYNHFFLSPVASAIVVVICAPLLVVLLFRRGEAALRDWLRLGLDADAELISLIDTGRVVDSPVGRYLQTLTSTFRGDVVADMLCYIRLHTELAIRAKGELMMRQHGFGSASFESEIRERFAEMRYLETNLGTAGRRALQPIIGEGSREFWQLRLLEGEAPK